MCALFTIVYIKAIKIELKELEEDVKEGFASLRSTIDGLKNQIQSSMQERERNWERKFGVPASASDLWDSTYNVPNVIDEVIKIKVHSIEGILATILTELPTPDDNDAIQVRTPDSNTYSDPWPLGPVDSEGQPHYPPSVQSIRTLADSLEQAVGTANVTWQDKAVGTTSITRQDKAVGTTNVTWQDKAVGTASIASEWQDKAVDTASIRVDWQDNLNIWVSSSAFPDIGILRHLLNAGAVAERLQNVVTERLQSAAAEHLLKDRVVRMSTVLAVAVISAIFYCLCTYTLQDSEDHAVLYY